MSLINQVLTDLDARRAGGGEAAALPTGVRAVAPQALQRDRQVGPWVAALGVGVVIAVAAWQWWPREAALGTSKGPAAKLTEPSATQASSAAVPERQPSADVTKAESSAGAAPIPSASSPAVRSTQAEAGEPDLRLAQRLRTDRVPATAGTIAQVLVPPRKPIPSSSEPAPSTADASGAPGTDDEPTAPRVDKQPRPADPAARARDRYRQALADAAQGRQAAALAGFQEAMSLDPSDGEIRQTLLRLLLDQGAFSAAEAVLADGLRIDMARRDWALLLSRLQLERGDQAAATTLLSTTLARQPDNAELAGALGAVLHQQRRYAEAVQRYRQATAGEPDNGRYWLGLALALEAGGSTAEARAAYQRALDSGSLSADLANYARGRLR